MIIILLEAEVGIGYEDADESGDDSIILLRYFATSISASSHLIVTTTRESRIYYYPHFTEEKTEAFRNKSLVLSLPVHSSNPLIPLIQDSSILTTLHAQRTSHTVAGPFSASP